MHPGHSLIINDGPHTGGQKTLKNIVGIVGIGGIGGRVISEASKLKKCHKNWKKSTIFLAPPPSLPLDNLDFFEFGKNLKFDDPPPPCA